MICNLLIGSIPGCCGNLTSLAMNIIGYKGVVTISWQFFLIAINTFIAIFINNIGILGLLPLIASIMSICFLKKDLLVIKYSNLIIFLLWAVHDFSMKMYIFGIADIIYIFIIFVSIIQMINRKKIITE